MKRLALAAILAFGLVSSGCIVVRPAHSRSAATSGGKCPPGHVWSDGRCHDKGKGHDKHDRR